MVLMAGANVRHSSESNEHFTPPHVVEAARRVLGTIDLDPFSCAKANDVVRAARYYDGLHADGWEAIWFGLLFVNPPGGMVDDNGQRVLPKCGETGACGWPTGHVHTGRHSAQKRAWQNLVREYDARRVAAAIFVCFSLELLQTTQVDAVGPLPLDFPICYPSKRLAYSHLTTGGALVPGTQPPHASCIVYLPPKDAVGESGGWPAAHGTRKFSAEFSPIGRVVIPTVII